MRKVLEMASHRSVFSGPNLTPFRQLTELIEHKAYILLLSTEALPFIFMNGSPIMFKKNTERVSGDKHIYADKFILKETELILLFSMESLIGETCFV